MDGSRRTRSRFGLVALAVALVVGLIATPALAEGVGNDGCTPGYWKNHTDNWEEATTSTLLDTEFDFPASLSALADDTFIQALQYKGGATLEDAAKILMRAAVAAWLNAAHDGLGYPLQRGTGSGDIEPMVNAALASEDRDTILALATYLDGLNNSTCPLN